MTGWYAASGDLRDHWPWICEQVVPWLTSHGIDANYCFRAEIDLLDMPLVRAHLYDHDEQGNLILHLVDGRTEPKTIVVERPMLSEPPPRPGSPGA